MMPLRGFHNIAGLLPYVKGASILFAAANSIQITRDLRTFNICSFGKRGRRNCGRGRIGFKLLIRGFSYKCVMAQAIPDRS